MVKDERDTMVAKPDNYETYLSSCQKEALKKLSAFGWKLEFIRRPLFKEPLAIVRSSDGSQYGVLEKDGKINLNPRVQMRTQEREEEHRHAS